MWALQGRLLRQCCPKDVPWVSMSLQSQQVSFYMSIHSVNVQVAMWAHLVLRSPDKILDETCNYHLVLKSIFFSLCSFAVACLDIGANEIECLCKPGYTGTRCERCVYVLFTVHIKMSTSSYRKYIYNKSLELSSPLPPPIWQVCPWLLW